MTGPRTSSYAAAWRTWFPLIERGALPLSQRMIALARIGPGDRVLDVGTGIGEPALTVARRLGPGGHVLAIDSDADMLAIARERARHAAIGTVEFAARRVEELQAPPGCFDAILARWSLMFVADLGAALARLRRPLRPGGTLVGAVWGPPERVPALSLARRVIHRHLAIAPPAHGPNTAFALADVERFADLVRAAGFVDVALEWVPVTYDFPSVAEYLRFRADCTGSLFSAAPAISEAARERAVAAVAAAMEPFKQADGTFRLANDACCVAARAP